MTDRVITPKMVDAIIENLELAAQAQGRIKISTLQDAARALRWARSVGSDYRRIEQQLNDALERNSHIETTLGMVAQGFTLINAGLSQIPPEMGGVSIVTDQDEKRDPDAEDGDAQA